MKKKHLEIMAILGLIFVTFIWGSTYVVMKNTLDNIPTFELLWIRFAIADLLLVIFFSKKITRVTRSSLMCGLISSLLLCGTYAFQTYGMQYTTVTNAALITNCYIVLVPLLNRLLYRAKLAPASRIGFLLAMVGVLLLSVKPGLTFPCTGDLYEVACSFCYAGFIVYLSYHGGKHDSVVLTMVQMSVITVVCACTSLLTEEQVSLCSLSKDSILSELYLAFLGSFACILLLNICERKLCVVVVSVLLSLESVFGILLAIPCLGERMNKIELIGFVFILIAVMLVILSHHNMKSSVSCQKCKVSKIPDE